jgi:hypothetical protein
LGVRGVTVEEAVDAKCDEGPRDLGGQGMDEE